MRSSVRRMTTAALSAAPRHGGLGLAAILVAVLLSSSACAQQNEAVRASSMLDVSGIAWVEQDLFVAVHDGKNNQAEQDWPRVSLLLLPADVSTPPRFAREASGGVYFLDLEVSWPSRKPNDLESIARIPGTRQFLLAESGDDCSEFQQIFLASLNTSYQLTIDEVVRWPSSGRTDCEGVLNVEGSAVFRLGNELFFVYAERAEGLPDTEIRWANMQLNPLRFGPFESVRYSVGVAKPGVRPVVALDIDAEGHVYAATAYDSGNDNGPFRSFVSRIGQFRRTPDGGTHFVPSGQIADIARQDGNKIEGVAIRPLEDGTIEVYAGTDDENYGAILRRVAPIPGSKGGKEADR